jgi:Protein of unknown function (DUF3562)
VNDSAIGTATISMESEIELLAQETDVPIDIVHQIYEAEHARLDRVARIKTYVPVLIRRQVKALLLSHRAAS